jgi:Uma2 family endonuclease
MTVIHAKSRYTPAEYYALEHEATYKSDYYEGEIFDMSGGTATHSLIISNIGGELRQRLKGKPCTAYDSNMRLKVEASSLRTYPDVTVYCEEMRYDPEDPRNTTALNPTVLFDVLSPTTEAYDRGLKATNYRLVKSLQAYAFVAKDRPHVELHYRSSGGQWTINDVQGMEASVPLNVLGIELPLAEIYDKVDFAADNPPAANSK